MKARRADEHFQSLDAELRKWAAKPYTVTKQIKFDKWLYVVWVDISLTPEIVPMLLGDFVCCLRSALDQLAWKLAHLDRTRIFTEREEQQIHFPIFKIRNNTYEDRRSLFPPAVADIIDTFQPSITEGIPFWMIPSGN